MFNSDFSLKLQSFSGFVRKWLTTHWQSLLLLVMGICLPLQIFSVLAVQIWKSQGGILWDVSILNAIHATAREQLDVFATRVTDLGVAWGVVPITTIVGLIFLRYRRWRSLIYLLIALLGSPLINRTAKFLFHRVRPHLWESDSPLTHLAFPGGHVTSFAFPSGHAMSSMTLVAALLVLTWGRRWFWLTFGIGSIYVVVIGWTRLYLSAHYPSDVLAGWMLSIAWVLGLSLLVKPHLTGTKAARDDQPTP